MPCSIGGNRVYSLERRRALDSFRIGMVRYLLTLTLTVTVKVTQRLVNMGSEYRFVVSFPGWFGAVPEIPDRILSTVYGSYLCNYISTVRSTTSGYMLPFFYSQSRHCHLSVHRLDVLGSG